MTRRPSPAVLALLALAACRPAPRTLVFDRFEEVQVFAPRAAPRDVVLLVSDDQGCDAALESAARALQREGSLVVCADLARYRRVLATLPGDEVYPGADLEVLGQYVQRALGLAEYRAPVVAGVGSGAAVAYAALAEQGPGTFRGGVGVDFCPSLALPKPAGPGTALALVEAPPGAPAAIGATPGPAAPFVVVERAATPSRCTGAEVEAFTHALPAGRLVAPAAPELSLADAVAAGLEALPPQPSPDGPDVTDLPLVALAPAGGRSDTLVVIVSGDGGWAALVRSVAGALHERGFGVLGVDALRYFWTPRTPDGAAHDLARAIRRHQALWGARRIALVGYSRGADVLPFLARRLPPEMRAQVALVALLAPGRKTSFEFHVTDWLGHGGGDPQELPVLPEVEALRGQRILCVRGDGEEDSLCDLVPAGVAEPVTLPGGHHFDGDYEALAARVADAIAAPPP